MRHGNRPQSSAAGYEALSIARPSWRSVTPAPANAGHVLRGCRQLQPPVAGGDSPEDEVRARDRVPPEATTQARHTEKPGAPSLLIALPLPSHPCLDPHVIAGYVVIDDP